MVKDIKFPKSREEVENLVLGDIILSLDGKLLCFCETRNIESSAYDGRYQTFAWRDTDGDIHTRRVLRGNYKVDKRGRVVFPRSDTMQTISQVNQGIHRPNEWQFEKFDAVMDQAEYDIVYSSN